MTTKRGTALVMIEAEIALISQRLAHHRKKADVHAAKIGDRHEAADRIVDWVEYRRDCLREASFMVIDLVGAIQPFVPYGGGDEPFDITVRAADVKRLREALARIGEVP